MNNSPISPMQQLCCSEYSSNRVWIKRDDLIPFSFGGNKVRIAEEYFLDMKKNRNDCIIGYGGTRSNMCRAIANMAYQKGIPCYIISPIDDGIHLKKTTNARLVRLFNAFVYECDKQKVAQTIKFVLDKCKAEGYKPYYVNGDMHGKGNEAVPVLAYYKAYSEICSQASSLDVKFDYIFTAVGTGMTQSGLIAGKTLLDGAEKIIGISIARSKELVKKSIETHLKAYCRVNHTNIDYEEVVIDDEYLAGGYGKYNQNIVNTILNTMMSEGIPLDTTYTGKAFYGMTEFLKKSNILRKNILFIHTGGTPLFFDQLNILEFQNIQISQCRNLERIVNFLKETEMRLPYSLSERVDIFAYVKKVISQGNILIIEDHKKTILSAAFFYTNDTFEQRAYLSLIITAEDAEGKGYSTKLLQSTENMARERGMKSIYLDTDYSNTHAVAFYSKNKYKIHSISRKIRMMKEL